LPEVSDALSSALSVGGVGGRCVRLSAGRRGSAPFVVGMRSLAVSPVVTGIPDVGDEPPTAGIESGGIARAPGAVSVSGRTAVESAAEPADPPSPFRGSAQATAATASASQMLIDRIARSRVWSCMGRRRTRSELHTSTLDPWSLVPGLVP
jgi:hypothetical protein